LTAIDASMRARAPTAAVVETGSSLLMRIMSSFRDVAVRVGDVTVSRTL
jgi:hypothetical protein